MKTPLKNFTTKKQKRDWELKADVGTSEGFLFVWWYWGLNSGPSP
jgi:hypothetical protein